MTMIYRGLCVSLLALGAASCTSYPTPLDKPNDVPTGFTAPPMPSDAPIWPTADWWTNFKASELPDLETRAQAENLDLAAATARVLESEASADVALAPLMPSVSASGTGSRRGNNVAPSVNTNSFGATLAASYQLDFFGLNQDRLRQADQQLRASRYAQTIVGLTIESNVANQYFNILALRERITIAKQNIDAAERILAITQAKVTNGVSSNLDLAQQQVVVAGQKARLPGLLESEREARYALAILLGRAPEGFDVSGQTLDGVVSPTVAPGLPSALLERRPDVAQAEANLYAAHANLDASRAAFFPQISLTGSGGYASSGINAINTLFNPANLAWSIGASIVQTIFDGGKLSAQNNLAYAQQTELIATYRKAVFSAFSDVETALGQVASDGDQLTLTTEQERAAAEAFRISELQYREGTIDILTVLNAQQSLFSAQDSLVQIQLARLQADVSLYNKLGGGWNQEASDAAYTPQLDWWPL